MADKDILMRWLRDAYAMEKSSEEMIENSIKNFEDTPEIRERLEDHLEETREQMEEVKGMLEAEDEDVSTIKDAAANIMGAIQGLMGRVGDDAMIRNALMAYAAEHFEHASYRAIEIAAEELNENEIADVAGRLADQEKEMAEFLEEQLPAAVKMSMQEILQHQ